MNKKIESLFKILIFVFIASFVCPQGVSVRARTFVGGLDAAALHRKINSVEKKLKKGVDPNKTDDEGKNTLFYALTAGYASPAKERKNTFKIVKLLVEHGADINLVCEEGVTPVAYAYINRYYNVVEYLADQGADITCLTNLIERKTGLLRNKESKKPRLIIGRCIGYIHPDYFREMLSDTDYIMFRDKDGKNLLHRTAYTINIISSRHEKWAKYFRTPYSDEEVENWSVLYSKILLEKGVELNAVNDAGETPLHLAAANGDIKLVEFFISQKAEINVLDSGKKTPLDRAMKEGHKEVAGFLKSIGAKSSKELN